MCKGGKKLLQFLFLFIIFLIFFISLLLILPYHYALSFEFKERLNYSFSFSVIFLKIFLKGQKTKQSLFIEIFNFKKELNLDDDDKITAFIKNKSKKLIKDKIDKKTSAEKKEKPAKSEQKSKFKFDFSLINRENLTHIFKFIVEMIKFLKMDYFKLSLVFSFADPYYNGIFLAYYYTFKEIFAYPDIKAQINWQEVVFEAEASAGGKIIPLKIIWQLFKFIFSLKSLKIFWKLYQSNSKKG